MRWVAAFVVAAVMMSACTIDEPSREYPETVSIEDYSYAPAEIGDTVSIRGFYFDQPARLCLLHLDSDPPQCGGFALRLDPDPEAVFASIITVGGEVVDASTIAVASWSYGP